MVAKPKGQWTKRTSRARLVRRLKDGYTITIAESCTGGLLASTLTDIAGAEVVQPIMSRIHTMRKSVS